jgi:L-seryl-tRNA(Ser) seleniumtransferase
MNASPNGNAIGRGMKVNKEEMLGMLVALRDVRAEGPRGRAREYDRRAEVIRSAVAPCRA